MSKPIMFMISIVGVSPKKFEIGGVAPTESPAGHRDDDPRLRRRALRLGLVDVEPRLEERRAADAEDRVDAGAARLSDGLRQRHQLAVVVADVEDRDLVRGSRRP